MKKAYCRGISSFVNMTTSEGLGSKGEIKKDAFTFAGGKEAVDFLTGQHLRNGFRLMLAANPAIAMCLENQEAFGRSLIAMTYAMLGQKPPCPEAAE